MYTRRLITNVFFVLNLFAYFAARGQKVNPYDPVKVGDTIPNYTFTNIINHQTRTAKLEDFRGKLLILDFWSTHCKSCINIWPKLLELQDEFKGKLQIVLINDTQDETTVRQAFERRNKLANVNVTLPTVCKDTILKYLFPYSGLPHVVWVSENGVVEAITSSGSINANNIRKLLNGETVRMPRKINNNDIIIPKQEEPLFINQNGGMPNNVISYSIFCHAIPELFPNISLIEKNANPNYSHISYITCTNASLSDLYRLAFSNRYLYSRPGHSNKKYLATLKPSRTELRVKNPPAFNGLIDSEIDYSNRYIFQYITPLTTVEELQTVLKSELTKHFNFTAEWKTLKRQCLVLKAKDSTLIKYKEGAVIYWIDTSKILINKINVTALVDGLEEQPFFKSQFPIIDETNFKGLLGKIEIETELSDYSQFNKALAKYKMSLSLEERDVAILVITEN